MLVFKPLDDEALEELLARAEEVEGRPLPLDAEARAALVRMADGDGRAALTLAEEVWRAAQPGRDRSTRRSCSEIVQRRAPIYDKAQDGHYNLISALHKSVRGSDPDAALYYLARMLDAGEDPLFLARRLVRMAVEDIGLADPQALVVANAAKDAYDFLGSPEGELALGAGGGLSGDRAEIERRPTPPSAPRCASPRRHGSLMPPKTHPQCADQADEGARATARATATTTTQPRPSPARTISRGDGPRSNSTSRSSAASSARSGSGWSIGPSCARSGAGSSM